MPLGPVVRERHTALVNRPLQSPARSNPQVSVTKESTQVPFSSSRHGPRFVEEAFTDVLTDVAWV